MKQTFGNTLVNSLNGVRGHIPIGNALLDLDVNISMKSVEGFPHTIYQLIMHMIYWQDFLLIGLRGDKPHLPLDVSESWPKESGPSSQDKLNEHIQHLLQGIEESCNMALHSPLDEKIPYLPSDTRADFLRNIASHNSYHLGQIVMLRRLFGSWPPPQGGYPK